MRFLWPSGGDMPDGFAGVLTTPATYGIPEGVQAGHPWAADNQAFTQGFNPDTFFPWLEDMIPFRSLCLFVPVPDVVGDAVQTLDNWRRWVRIFEGWPLAFVAQDGQEDLPMPPDYDVLFIGGSTEWKESAAAIDCIKRAEGRLVHIGRINNWRRYRHFARMPGAENWTCDGTRIRYERDKATRDWQRYMAQPPLITI